MAYQYIFEGDVNLRRCSHKGITSNFSIIEAPTMLLLDQEPLSLLKALELVLCWFMCASC